MNNAWRARFIGLFTAVIFSGLFLYATNLVGPHGALYSGQVIFREQTNAFMLGKFSIFDDPYSLSYDLVYLHGKAQQVWGLGVPLLRLPFELLSHGYFPDRITLGLYFALAGSALFGFILWFLRRHIKNLSELEQYIVAMLITFCVMFMTALVSLAQTRFVVYEETIFYSVIASILIFISAFRAKSIKMLYVLSFFTGFVTIFRPTLFAYGIAALLVLLYRVKWDKKRGSIMILLCLFGLFLVGLTNYIRFDSFTEFGHGLNIDTDSLNNYQLKFENQFAHTAVYPAAKELVGALFFNTKLLPKRTVFGPDMVAFQAPTMRWRNFYSYTFSSLHLGLVLISFGFMIVAGIQFLRYRNLKHFFLPIESVLMFTSANISFVLLFGFYLFAPSISSRYIVDFTGAIAMMMVTLLLSGIYVVLHYRPSVSNKILCLGVILLLVTITVQPLGRSSLGVNPTTKNLTKEKTQTILNRVIVPNALIGHQYVLGERLQKYGFFDGAGLDTLGHASSTVLFFMKDISNINLTIQGTCSLITDNAIKLKIGTKYIVPQIEHEGTTTNVMFEIPPEFRTYTWPVFIKLFDTTVPFVTEKGCSITKVTW